VIWLVFAALSWTLWAIIFFVTGPQVPAVHILDVAGWIGLIVYLLTDWAHRPPRHARTAA
jgi:hypothetical protein